MRKIKIGFWSLFLSMLLQSVAFGQMGADSTSIIPFANYGYMQNTVITTAPTYVSTKGSCGSSNGTTVSNANQLNNLCSSGSPSGLYTNGNVIAWSCTGNYGAPSAASCSANVIPPGGSLTVTITYRSQSYCSGVGSGSAPPTYINTTVVSVPYTVSGNTAQYNGSPAYSNGNTVMVSGNTIHMATAIAILSVSVQGQNGAVNYPALSVLPEFDCSGAG